MIFKNLHSGKLLLTVVVIGLFIIDDKVNWKPKLKAVFSYDFKVTFK